MKGRKKPYTMIGIRRLKCPRCGKMAEQQWQICSDNRIFRPKCTPCDIELNELVLRFMGFPDADEKMKAYREKLGVEDVVKLESSATGTRGASA